MVDYDLLNYIGIALVCGAGACVAICAFTAIKHKTFKSVKYTQQYLGQDILDYEKSFTMPDAIDSATIMSAAERKQVEIQTRLKEISENSETAGYDAKSVIAAAKPANDDAFERDSHGREVGRTNHTGVITAVAPPPKNPSITGILANEVLKDEHTGVLNAELPSTSQENASITTAMDILFSDITKAQREGTE
jgi:hypothetical protein